jgi:hypothetical protein
MKKVVELIFLTILLLSFGSCGKNPNQNDLEKMNLKGDVVLIKDREYIFFNDKGNSIKKYNEFTDGIGEYINIANYFYIENKLSKITSLITLSIQNKIYKTEIQESFNYDNDGNLTTSARVTGDGDKKIGGITYYFYQKGKLVTDSTLSNYIDYSITQVNNFKYNGESLIRIDHTQIRSGNVDDKSMSYSSDFYENGLVTKEVINNEKTLSYEYEYDMKGNWIKQTKSDGSIRKREIFYKGDDISLYENKFDELKKEISSNRSETNNNQDPTSNNEVVPDENNIQSNNTVQQQEKRKCYSCNGTGQCPKCSKPQRVRYKQGESPNDHNEIRQGMIVCTQCGGNLMNFGADKNKSCYLCKATGWLYCPECNIYGNGSYIGKCKRCKGTGFDN